MKKTWKLISALITLFAAHLLFVNLPGKVFAAGTVNLARTGQTMSYASGDDGALQKGVAWPSPRFSTNADTTVTDNLTGLVWAPYGTAPTVGSCAGGSMSWPQAFIYVACLNSINYLGHSDWRMPNINELESLVHEGIKEEFCGLSTCENTAAWLNAQGFQNVTQFWFYWSSTTYDVYTPYAWGVNMGLNVVGPQNVNKDTFPYNNVWPVRGTATGPAKIWKTGQTTSYATGDDGDLQMGMGWPFPRFTDNGNGTITDNLTGLVWLKNANCFGNKNWLNALDSANSLADGQCGLTDGSQAGDWRLPNMKELRSLVDHSRSWPALPANCPLTNLQLIDYATYWSSTTDAHHPGLAKSIVFTNGCQNSVNMTESRSLYVLPVRDIQAGALSSLTIAKSGSGNGTVTSNPAGIDCGADCTEAYSSGTSVTLQAIAHVGSAFAGWSGGTGSAAICSGVGNCTFNLTTNSSLTATFILAVNKIYLPIIGR